MLSRAAALLAPAWHASPRCSRLSAARLRDTLVPAPNAALRPIAAPSRRGKHVNFPSRPAPPPDADIEEFFLKGSGPGGQKINKTNSAVQLRHKPTGLVVKSQATRSRSQNRSIARQLLADRLDQLNNGDQSRAAIVGAAKAKKRASSAKKSRRKYRKLDDEKLGPSQDFDSEDGETEAAEEEEEEESQEAHRADPVLIQRNEASREDASYPDSGKGSIAPARKKIPR